MVTLGTVRRTPETSSASGGQPGGGLVFDLPQQQFCLMGGWSEWRVEDPWALRNESEERERVSLYYRGSETDGHTENKHEQYDMIRSIHTFLAEGILLLFTAHFI